MRMPVTLILLGLLCACTATHRQENAAKLVVFGDSLSDQGNMITLLRDMTQLHHLHMTHPLPLTMASRSAMAPWRSSSSPMR